MQTSYSKIPGYGWATKSYFKLGSHTLAIPMSVHLSNRLKVLENFSSIGINSGIILINGGSEAYQDDTDKELLFRQNSWFNYIFGVKEPGFLGAIDISSKESSLFIPNLPDDYKIWCGEIHSQLYFKSMYEVDHVLYYEDISSFLDKFGNDTPIYVLDGVNTDSGSRPKEINFPNKELFTSRFNGSVLYDIISNSRVVKSESEIEVLRYCSWITSNAHVEVMRNTKPEMMEFELEALFLYEVYRKGGCRHCSYTTICACGPNSAVLHYGHAGAPNNRKLQPGDMALFDMGSEYHGYCSDITCSFPVSGRFTADQRLIYEAVLAAQRVVMEAARPGVYWTDCHQLAEREILKALLSAGVLVGELEELVEAGLGPVFFPHGLGHLIGCDAHDVGGYIASLTPARSTRPGLSKLRTSRCLQTGMVLTNEPGCYFIPHLLDLALGNPNQSKHMVPEALDRFRGFGGVRLEDMIVITEGGVQNITLCPRTVEEVEGVLAGGPWPPRRDTAPYLRRRWSILAEEGSHMVDVPVASCPLESI